MMTEKSVKSWDEERQEENLEMSRFIFLTGKMIGDRMLRVFSGFREKEGLENDCAELSWPQMCLAMVLKEKGEASISEIAVELNVTAPSASAMVDRLVEKGLVEREHSQEDRRKVNARLSPKAGRLLEEMEDRIFGEFLKLVERLGPEVTRKWYEVLIEVRRVMDEEKWGIPSTD